MDITMASGNERGINDHPLYRSKQMNMAFYYDQKSLPLLTTPYKVDSFGYFNIQEPDLPAQLSLILDALQAQESNKREVAKLKVELHQTQQQLHRSIDVAQNHAQESDYQKLLARIIHQIDQQCQRYDFFSALDRVFGELNFIDQYSLLELTYNGQKLVAPSTPGKEISVLPQFVVGHGSRGPGDSTIRPKPGPSGSCGLHGGRNKNIWPQTPLRGPPPTPYVSQR